MKKVLNIAIIGAGVGGLASALYLARQGHVTTIFERFTHNKPLGSGLLLQPPGQDVLDDLGVLADIKAHSAVISALKSNTSKAKKILDLNYGDLSGEPCNGLGINRALLHNILLDEATKQGVTFIFGQEIIAIDKTTGHIASADKDHGHYDAIIIATGARDLLCDKYIQRRKRQYSWSCLWANVTLPADCPPDVLSQRCKQSNHMIGLIPLRHNDDGSTTAAFFWSLNSRRLADWRAQDYGDFVNDVRNIWPSAALAIEGMSHSDFSHAIYYDSWSNKPWNGKILTIGDAIHCTSPQLGQGATAALMDAKALAAAIATHSDLDCAYRSFWKSRKEHLRYVRLMSRIVTPFFQSNSKILGYLRDILCHRFTKSGVGQRIALETLASRREKLF